MSTSNQARKRTLLSAAVVILLLAGGTTTATESSLATPAGFSQCLATCEPCDPPSSRANFTAEEGDEAAPFGCGQSSCGGCRVALDPKVKATVIYAATHGRSAELHRLMTHHPGKILLYEARSAIQIVGCDGRIDTHIPVTAEVAGALLGLE